MSSQQEQTAKTDFKVLKEGAVSFITEFNSKNDKKGDEKETTFYNPVQVFNRDLSLLMTYTFAKKLQSENKEKFKGIRFYDALSASGYLK